MEQSLPNITQELQAAIRQIEIELQELDAARRNRRADLKKHQKALRALSGSARAAKKGEVCS